MLYVSCRRVTLTFEPAQTELHMAVVVLQDESPENTESFTVDIVNPRDGAEVGAQSSVTVNILSNDNAHGIIQFAPVSQSGAGWRGGWVEGWVGKDQAAVTSSFYPADDVATSSGCVSVTTPYCCNMCL